ncbi:hypothetical protein VitviT2T_026488 [Vitis vinifera]|uniref:Uncharacterized protein n=1 Tax=Vitis vinifera TaxID=29760 RepID=A0ABY9DM41_VITVI|nr:hypothetical protein VitviT2T_026488 [Vitis vinifera]
MDNAEMIRNRSVMRKAQEKVRSTVRGKYQVEESDLSQLIYLKLVVKESLRLHLPAPSLVPRKTTKNCTIRGSIDFRGQSFEFLPFGASMRGCPGANFAVLLIEVALTNILHRLTGNFLMG